MSAAAPPLTTAEADRLADRFESRTAEHVLAWAAERFGERAVLTCSWQKQSSVLVHMVSQVAPGMRVVELDTGVLFPETYETREKLIARYPIQFERILPELTLEEQAAEHGERLWERDPDACCGIRKVAPLKLVLDDSDAWITGISAGAVDNSRKCTQNRAGRTPRRGQDPAVGGLDESRRLALHLEARHPVQPAARPRIPVDRVHPVHHASRRQRSRRAGG